MKAAGKVLAGMDASHQNIQYVKTRKPYLKRTFNLSMQKSLGPGASFYIAVFQFVNNTHV